MYPIDILSDYTGVDPWQVFRNHVKYSWQKNIFSAEKRRERRERRVEKKSWFMMEVPPLFFSLSFLDFDIHFSPNIRWQIVFRKSWDLANVVTPGGALFYSSEETFHDLRLTTLHLRMQLWYCFIDGDYS